jgi:uncharacterized protein YfaT (DUF1175 family)
MELIRLVDYGKPYLSRGSVLRFFTKGFSNESVVDFMIFDQQDDDQGMGLITITGYHAGLIYVSFPKESNSNEIKTISTGWLIDNWNKWVCPECDINDVYVFKYPDAKI